MKSYNINDDKVKICLTSEEVEALFGSFDLIDYDSPRSRAVLNSIICSALPERMLPFDCEKVLIEISPEKNGCSIQVTRIYDKGKCREKTKRRRQYILLFESSEDMIGYIKSLPALSAAGIYKSRLYRRKRRYALHISTEEGGGALIAAAEYARIISLNDPAAGIITEHWEYMYSAAAEKLFKAFNNSITKKTVQ